MPSLLSQAVQKHVLSLLLHRDLVSQKHQTNLHLHHALDYPEDGASFFSLPKSQVIATPKDPQVHKSLSVEQILQRKLRWLTLGGQYDWTNKVYPDQIPPDFPLDLAKLIQDLLPEMIPQAAIVNFYSPGDTLSMHRDVAEEIDRSLVSISIGCDSIFVIGLEQEDESSPAASTNQILRHTTIRLRSGDAVFMTGRSRFAWHGVSKVIPETCPEYLLDWPGEFPAWRGYMRDKRINLNVRQMQ